MQNRAASLFSVPHVRHCILLRTLAAPRGGEHFRHLEL